MQGIAPVEEGKFALDMLRAIGPGGTFLDSEQTYRRYRIDALRRRPRWWTG